MHFSSFWSAKPHTNYLNTCNVKKTFHPLFLINLQKKKNDLIILVIWLKCDLFLIHLPDLSLRGTVCRINCQKSKFKPFKIKILPNKVCKKVVWILPDATVYPFNVLHLHIVNECCISISQREEHKGNDWEINGTNYIIVN